jgi:AcrR family transcriptional regulator
VLATASTLFNRRGVEGVSLDDVAAAVGATKGLVYHRHKSKPAFVAACYERAFALYDAIMDVSDKAECGLDAARRGLELNIQAQLSASPPLSLTAGFDILSASDRERFAARTRLLRSRAAEHGRQGVRDGSLRAYDLKPVSLASAGVFSYLAKWPLRTNLAPSEIARQVADVLLFGLAKR